MRRSAGGGHGVDVAAEARWIIEGVVDPLGGVGEEQDEFVGVAAERGSDDVVGHHFEEERGRNLVTEFAVGSLDHLHERDKLLVARLVLGGGDLVVGLRVCGQPAAAVRVRDDPTAALAGERWDDLHRGDGVFGAEWDDNGHPVDVGLGPLHLQDFQELVEDRNRHLVAKVALVAAGVDDDEDVDVLQGLGLRGAAIRAGQEVVVEIPLGADVVADVGVAGDRCGLLGRGDLEVGLELVEGVADDTHVLVPAIQS